MDSSEEALIKGPRNDSKLRHSICHPSNRAVKMRLKKKKPFFPDLFYQSSLLVIDVIEWIALIITEIVSVSATVNSVVSRIITTFCP